MRRSLYIVICFLLTVGIASAFPRTAPEYFKMGQKFYKEMDFQGALFSFEAGLVLIPTSAPGYQGLGNCYYSLGRTQEALTAYQKALELNPKNTRLAAFVEKLKLQPMLPDGMVAVKASAAMETPFPTVPTVTPTPNLSSSSTNASDYFKMGTKLYQVMDFQGALFNFQTGLSLAPQSAPGYQGLGNCYYSLGKSQDALTAYQKSLALNPNNPHLTSFVEMVKAQASGSEGMVMVKDNAATAIPLAASVPATATSGTTHP